MAPMIINPGTGPVEDATEAHAEMNMERWVRECGVSDVSVERKAELDHSGRYGFSVSKNGIEHEIEMPGIPYVPRDDILAFPRLYVDGSSWAWGFSLLDEEAYESR